MPDGIPANNPETCAQLLDNRQRLLIIQPGCISSRGMAATPEGH